MIGFNLYGISLSLALLTAYSLTAYRCSKRGLSSDLVWDSLPWVVFFGLIGARLYHVLNFISLYLQNPILIPQVWRGGLGIYGALVGGLIGLAIYFKFSFRRSDLPGFARLRAEGLTFLGKYLDAAAPGIALGQAIGRVGNIFNGENLPFAYWEIVTNLIIFLLLICVERFQGARYKMQGGGNLFLLYLLGYSVTRFILEFFRTDSPWVVGPLTMAQWISLVIAIVILKIFIGKSHTLPK